jgi:hypothetical protein
MRGVSALVFAVVIAAAVVRADDLKIAADKKCLLADLHAGFIDALAKKPVEAKGTQLTSDGVHMNGVGDWLMAEVIVGALGVPKEKVEAAKTAR